MNHAEVEVEIRKYIREHPGTTINKVALHLSEKKLASYAPAYKKIKYLIDGGIILDRKEGNSLHRLFINDESDFNIIDEQLTETENVLNQFEKPIRKISELYGRYRRNKANDFKKEYQLFFMWTFHALLVFTAHSIQSERQSQALFRKIVELMLKFDNQFSIFDYYDFTFGGNFFEELLHPTVKKMGVDEKSINDLRQLNYGINHIVSLEDYDAKSKSYEERRRQIQMRPGSGLKDYKIN